MKIAVRNSCRDFRSYRAERVKSLFNCESGASFEIDAEIPVEDASWKVGLVVGPSGSGKSSIGRRIFGPEHVADLDAGWPEAAPIIDAIGQSFDQATGALSAVGLGSVPPWLRPFHALSTGEKFRAGIARLVCQAPASVVVDEWTSVIDRKIARVGSMAFSKAWRRGSGRAVLLSCHYDIIPWLQPDWIFDTATGKFTGRCLWRRPPIHLEITETDWRYWPLFEPHHYLKLPHMIAAKCYVGTVGGEPVAHVGAGPKFEVGCMRACRLVIMPEWQGAGIGMRFLNEVAKYQAAGLNRWGRKVPTLFHTSHPGLAAALRRDRNWRQCSAVLCGGSKARSRESVKQSAVRNGREKSTIIGAGYGGHFRAVQGFKYITPCGF
jgi:GNAT superfamily N-acetyltransferase